MYKYKHPSEEANAQNLFTNFTSCAPFISDNKTPDDDETDYKPLYFGLCTGINDIIENERTYEDVIVALKYLLLEAENAYIEQAE